MSDDVDSVVPAARGVDEEAFAVLAEPLRRELLAHCYRILGSLHEAEDMVQEAFLRAWRGFHKFEPRASFRAWLLAVYHQASPRRVYEAFALQVLTIDGSAWQISEVTTFLNADLFHAFGLAREIPM